MKTILTIVALIACAAGARAQSTIDPVQAFAWAGNAGWTNWRPSAADGVVIGRYVCSGHVFCANAGWVDMGSGAPADGIRYSNTVAGDYGVNIMDTPTQGLAVLRGFAYGANIGWINFENQGNPRLNLTNGKLSGYAWSANCGWINLGSGTTHGVTTSTILPTPDIAVFQPAGTGIPDGGTHSFGTVLVGSPASLIFTITNPGTLNLTGLTITRDGTNAANFTMTASPAAPVLPGGSTTFTIRFAPTTSGAKTAVIHIANNVAGKNPYDITLTGQSLSFTTDTDGDGLNDASEFLMAALGFNWQTSQPALVNTYYANANGAGLYTASQVQALNVGARFLERNPATGQFTLEIGMEKSTDLTNFVPFPFIAPQTTVRPTGKLEFLFTAPDNAAFFRIEAR